MASEEHRFSLTIFEPQRSWRRPTVCHRHGNDDKRDQKSIKRGLASALTAPESPPPGGPDRPHEPIQLVDEGGRGGGRVEVKIHPGEEESSGSSHTSSVLQQHSSSCLSHRFSVSVSVPSYPPHTHTRVCVRRSVLLLTRSMSIRTPAAC